MEAQRSARARRRNSRWPERNWLDLLAHVTAWPRLYLRVLVAVMLAWPAGLLSATPAAASVGLPTSASLTANDTTTGATGVTYTATYTPSTTGPLTKMVWNFLPRGSDGTTGVTVPAGTTLAVTEIAGLGNVSSTGGATASLEDFPCGSGFTSTCRRLAVNLPVGAKATKGTTVAVKVSGFKNPTFAGRNPSVRLETWQRSILVERATVGLPIGTVTGTSTDTTPPAVTGVSVDRASVTVDFGENVQPCCGDLGFSVRVNGSDVPVTDTTSGSSSSQLRLTLEDGVLPGANVTLSYTPPVLGTSGSPVTDTASPIPNALTAFTTGAGGVPAVTNNTPDSAGAIGGQIKDASGAPIPHAQVRFNPSFGGAGASAYADATGSYTVVVSSAGAYRGQAHMNEDGYPATYTTQDVQVTAGQTTTGVDLVLTRGFVVTGTVTTAATSVTTTSGGKVSGVQIEARPASGTGRSFWASTSGWDSAYGQYTIALPLGAFNLYAYRQSDSFPRTAASANPIGSGTAGEVKTQDFVLAKGKKISGTVTTDGSAANPVTNAYVRLVDHANPANEIDRFWLSSSPCSTCPAAGQFELVVAAGTTTYDAVVQADGYFRTVIPVNPNASGTPQAVSDDVAMGTINLNSSNPRTIGGTVAGPSGSSFSTRVRASLRGVTSISAQTPVLAVSGTSGTVYALRVPDGTWDVRVDSVAGYVMPARVTTAALSSAAPIAAGVTFTFTAGYRISGKITADGTTGIGGASVRIVDQNNPTGPSFAGTGTSTSASTLGTFAVTVPQSLTNSLAAVVAAPGYFPVVKPLNGGNPLGADVPNVDVSLDAENPNTISGAVSLPSGQPAQQINVRAWRAADSNRSLQAVSARLELAAGASVSYSLKVPDGTWTVAPDTRYGVLPSPKTASVAVGPSARTATQNFAYAAGYKIGGVVTVDGAEPFEGASIHVVDHNNQNGPDIVSATTSRTTTDADGNAVPGGKFFLTVPSTGAPPLDLVVRAEGYFPVVKYLGAVSGDLAGGSALSIGLNAANPHTITGTITMPSGTPASTQTGVSAWVPGVPGGRFTSVSDYGLTSGASYSLRVPAGTWTVRPYNQAGLVTPSSQTVRVGGTSSATAETATASFTYAAGNTIAGTVRGLTGSPLGNAAIRVRSTDPMIGYDVASTRTRTDGTYAVTVLPGRYFLFLQLDGYNTDRLDGYFSLAPDAGPIVDVTSANASGVDFTLNAAGRTFATISGTVTSNDSAFDPTQTRVSVSRAGTGASGQYGNVVPAPSGAFALKVPAGEGSWHVGAGGRPGYLLSGAGTVALSSTATGATVNLAYQRAEKTLSGTVSRREDSTQKVAGARIWANRSDGAYAGALTGADGKYELMLTAGTWRIGVGPDSSIKDSAGWIFGQPSIQVSFGAADPATQTLDIGVYTADAIVTGRILQPGGAPTTGSAGLYSQTGIGNGTTLDNAGNFRIRVPAGTYRLRVPPSPTYTLPLPASSYTFAAGSTTIPTITLAAKSATVTGKVTNASAGGSPGIAGIAVGAFSAQGWGGSAVTDASGNYSLKLVPADSTGTPIRWRIAPSLPPDAPYLNPNPSTQVQPAAGETATADFALLVGDATVNVTLRNSATNAALAQGALTTGSVYVRGTSPTAGVPGISFGRGIRDGSETISLRVPAGSSTTSGWTWKVGIGLPPNSGFITSAQQTITPAAGGTTSVTFDLLPTDATITGTLKTPNGTTITGVRANVFASGTSGIAAGAQVGGQVDPATGRYRLAVRGGESWQVSISIDPRAYPDYLLRPDTRRQTVAATDFVSGTATIDFVAIATDATIGGRVTNGSNAVAGARVQVFQPAAGSGSSATPPQFVNGGATAADGTYAIKVPAGTYSVIAVYATNSGQTLPPAPQTVTVAAGATATQDFAFRTTNATISGTAKAGTSGVPALIRAHSLTGMATSVRAAAGGTYSLAVVNGDTWKIEAIYNDASTRTLYRSSLSSVELSASSTTASLNLTLTAGRRLPAARSIVFPATQSQTITLDDGAGVTFPAGSLAGEGDVTVTITPRAELAGTGKKSPLGLGYEISAADSQGNQITSLAVPVSIVIPYLDADLAVAGIANPSKQLAASYVDAASGALRPAANVIVDTTNKQVTISENHLTTYTIEADLETASVTTTVSQSLALSSGWNLSTLTVTPADTSPQALVAASNNLVDILIGFDAAAGQARAYFTDPAKAVLNSLTSVQAGMGYWVHTTGAGNVGLSGAGPASTVSQNLSNGWNLVGWQGASGAGVPAALNQTLGSNWDIIIGFDAAQGQAKAYFTDPAKAVLNSLDSLTTGAGYWLHTTTATTWTYTP